MNKYFKIIIVAAIIFNLSLCAWYVIHKDIYFFTDVARDFLLLQEVDQKKMVFVGPRSSTSGLFHGPLWTYVNFPAYKIGRGDPIVVGWYWIVLISSFLVMCFFIARKLFDEATAYLYTLFLSGYLIFEARALYNPHGALFLLPLFFFLFIRYQQTSRLIYLLSFFFVAGCVIQFHIGVGIPFLFLATVPLVYFCIKRKKKKHLLAFLILLLPLSTFIIFDLRHRFLELHSAFQYAFGSQLDKHYYTNYFSVIVDRLKFIAFTGTGLFKDGSGNREHVAGIILAVFLFMQIKQNKFKNIYFTFLYFYVGYYLLSIINRSGGMLYQYYMPIFGLTFLIYASFITSYYRKFFLPLFLLAFVFNMYLAIQYIQGSNSFIGKHVDSWKALSEISQKIYTGQEKEFGYFVYAPDALAYQPKYAMAYAGMHSAKKAYSFQKKSVTYLVIAPPPPDRPFMKDAWWRINQVRITNQPNSVVTFPNGFKIERYVLSEKDIKIPFDPAIDTGIHFR